MGSFCHTSSTCGGRTKIAISCVSVTLLHCYVFYKVDKSLWVFNLTMLYCYVVTFFIKLTKACGYLLRYIFSSKCYVFRPTLWKHNAKPGWNPHGCSFVILLRFFGKVWSGGKTEKEKEQPRKSNLYSHRFCAAIHIFWFFHNNVTFNFFLFRINNLQAFFALCFTFENVTCYVFL